MATKRITPKECSVVFNEEDHSYYLPEKDKFLSGITGMLERQLFPDTYTGIPDEILKQASAYGTSIHRAIEDFDMDWTNDGSQEVEDYIRLCAENELVHECSEYLITDNEHYASMIDKVYRVDDSTFDIGDIKTYGQMTPEKKEKARWQLSVYAYLFELQNKKAKVRRLFILHIRNRRKNDGSHDHISDFIPVTRIPSEVVKELLDADSSGEQFVNPYSIPEDIRSQEQEIRTLIQMKQDAENRLNAIKASILAQMESQDIRSWATETMRITRKLPTTRRSFSLDAFKAAHSEIDVEPFMKVSQVSSSLAISV